MTFNINDLSIVTVAYNSEKFIKTCLESIDNSIEIYPVKIVVDNGSSDSTIKLIKSCFCNWTVISSDRNGGYGYGANIGIRKTLSKYVLVMNPDVVVENKAILRLVEFMESSPDAGIASCQLRNRDGTIQASFRRFPSIKFMICRLLDNLHFNKGHVYSYRYLMIDSDFTKIQDVDWLFGSFLMLRREALDQTGLFDERFFLYCEDVDLCARMKKMGWRVVYVPNTWVTHYHGQASQKNIFSQSGFVHFISMLRFLSKELYNRCVNHIGSGDKGQGTRNKSRSGK